MAGDEIVEMDRSVNLLPTIWNEQAHITTCTPLWKQMYKYVMWRDRVKKTLKKENEKFTLRYFFEAVARAIKDFQ